MVMLFGGGSMYSFVLGLTNVRWVAIRVVTSY